MGRRFFVSVVFAGNLNSRNGADALLFRRANGVKVRQFGIGIFSGFGAFRLRFADFFQTAEAVVQIIAPFGQSRFAHLRFLRCGVFLRLRHDFGFVVIDAFKLGSFLQHFFCRNEIFCRHS